MERGGSKGRDSLPTPNLHLHAPKLSFLQSRLNVTIFVGYYYECLFQCLPFFPPDALHGELKKPISPSLARSFVQAHVYSIPDHMPYQTWNPVACHDPRSLIQSLLARLSGPRSSTISMICSRDGIPCNGAQTHMYNAGMIRYQGTAMTTPLDNVIRRDRDHEDILPRYSVFASIYSRTRVLTGHIISHPPPTGRLSPSVHPTPSNPYSQNHRSVSFIYLNTGPP